MKPSLPSIQKLHGRLLMRTQTLPGFTEVALSLELLRTRFPGWIYPRSGGMSNAARQLQILLCKVFQVARRQVAVWIPVPGA